MQRVVLALHAKGIVHGGIRLSNFLLCNSDNPEEETVVKLTNFHNSLSIANFSPQAIISEREERQWIPILASRIVSPNRANDWIRRRDRKSAKEDDLYALEISMWEIWSGKKYDEMCGIRDDVRRGDLKGRGVDIKGMEDKGVRAWVRGCLRGRDAIF